MLLQAGTTVEHILEMSRKVAYQVGKVLKCKL